MTSRTYRTCERIMEAVVGSGFTYQIPWIKLKTFIKKVAGGDPRTLKNYREHLLEFGFVEIANPPTIKEMLSHITGRTHPIFQINLLKLPYAQTRLDEIIQAKKVIVQAERNHLSVNGEMKAQK